MHLASPPRTAPATAAEYSAGAARDRASPVDRPRAGSHTGPALLTFFTIPKPFTGHAGVIQRNALASWSRAAPGAEILVCGDETGAREAAASAGARLLPAVERSALGTPLVGPTFALAAREASHPLLVYVNADIVLLPGFGEALGRVTALSFLLVARRWDLDITEPIDFSSAGWARELAARVRAEGRLFRRDALDCFAFPRACPLVELPPFAVGRPGWDNYLVYRARELRLPVIDATSAVTLVHQNHGYGHVPGSTGDRWEGPEARANRALMGGTERTFDIGDATHVLTGEGLERAWGLWHLLRRVETAHLRFPALAPLGKAGFALRGVPALARRVLAAARARSPRA